MAISKRPTSKVVLSRKKAAKELADQRDSWLLPLAETDSAIMRLLRQAPGTPIDLTDDQAREIVEAGIGARPDLPRGLDYVKQIKKSVWAPSKSSDRSSS